MPEHLDSGLLPRRTHATRFCSFEVLLRRLLFIVLIPLDDLHTGCRDACENSNASACSTRIAPSLDAYEFGRGPTGGAYHLSAQPGVGAAASGGSFGKRPACAFDDLLDIDYSRSSESDLMNSGELDEDESLGEVEKQLHAKGGEPGKDAQRDCCEDMGGGDHDEITHLADPLDFLQDTAESCSIFWGEEAV